MRARKTMIALSAMMALTAQAVVNYRWNAVDGVFDDNFTNYLHWVKVNTTDVATHVLGEDGVEDENAIFHTSPMGAATDGYTVAYPKGDYTNSAGLTFSLTRSAGVMIDGTGTHLVYPCPTGDHTVKNNGLSVGMGQGGANPIFSFEFNGQPIFRELFNFNDFKILATNSLEERRFEFVQGDFLFLASQYMRFFQDTDGVLPPPVIQVDADADVTYTNQIACFWAPSDSNLVRVIGGKLNLYCSLQLPVTTFSASFKESPQLLELSAVDGGELRVGQNTRSIGFGSTKSVGTAAMTIRLLADNARLEFNYKAQPESVGKGRHEIVLRNGATGILNGTVQLGKYASATGVVSIADSSVVTSGPSGEWILGGQTAAAIDAGSWGELIVERSNVSMTNAIAVTAGRVRIEDSEIAFESNEARIYSRDQQGGTSTLELDGASVVLSSSSTTAPFAGFTTAEIGSKGLVVKSGKDITVPQSFASKSGQSGVLTLAGAGTKTLSGDISLAKVEVLDGDVIFAGECTAMVVATNGAAVSFGGQTSAERPLAGLVVGSETSVGVLAVSPGEKIYVADGAAVSLRNLRLVVSGGSFAAGETVSLVCGGSVPEAVSKAWGQALVNATFDEGYTWNVREVALPGGGTELVVEPVPGDPLVITVPDSTSETHTTNILYSAGMALKTVLGTDATLDLRGSVGYGKIWQAQGGRTTVSGAYNAFMGGVQIDGGVLHVADISTFETRDDSALTFNGGAFSVAGTGKVKGVATVSTATKTTPMVFKTEGDVEMDIPNFSQGKCLKLGDGRLAFNVASDRSFMNMGWASGRPLAYDALNGVLTAGASATLDVAEGTLAFTSAAATAPSVTIYNADIVLGGETSTREAGPVALELDHVKLTATYNNNVGKVSILERPADMPNRTSASVTLRNGAVLDVWQYYAGGNYTVRHTVDASTLQTRGSVYFSSGGAGVTIAGTNFWRVTNGGRVYVNDAAGPYVYAPGVYEFDRGTLAKNAAGEPTRFRMVNPIANSCQQFFLRNRSYFAVSYFGCNGANQSFVFNYDSQRYELTFDDSEWFAGAGERTIASSNMIVTVTTTGGGLRMNPPADSTWTLYTRVDGDAGLFKGGAGTMIVDRAFRKHEYLADPCTLAYEGRTTVTGGTLKVVNGACEHHVYGLGGGATLDLDGAAIRGADIEAVGDGTLVNAGITGLTLRPQYADGVFAQITFGANTSLAGRTVVDFGRTSDNPLPTDIHDAVVARWTGTKPDVGRWRSANLGNDLFRFVFAANDNGTITGSCVRKGGISIVIY